MVIEDGRRCSLRLCTGLEVGGVGYVISSPLYVPNVVSSVALILVRMFRISKIRRSVCRVPSAINSTTDLRFPRTSIVLPTGRIDEQRGGLHHENETYLI